LSTRDIADAVELAEHQRDTWVILKRLPFVPSFILGAFIILAICADVIAPHNP
jgi:prepilin signal peptidase PulO-like enzyme (type II secretory pathway)